MSLYVVISRNSLLDTGQLGGQDMCCRLQGVGAAAAPAVFFVVFSVAIVVLVVAGVMVMIIFAAAVF